MKKTIVVTFGVLVVAALALAIIPTTRDEIHWRWASYTDATASYESYTKSWPEGGKYVVEAKDRIESLRWQDATKEDAVNSFERFIKLHSDSKHVVEAKDRIESLRWQDATKENTVNSFERYVQLHSMGRHVVEAKDRIES